MRTETVDILAIIDQGEARENEVDVFNVALVVDKEIFGETFTLSKFGHTLLLWKLHEGLEQTDGSMRRFALKLASNSIVVNEERFIEVMSN